MINTDHQVYSFAEREIMLKKMHDASMAFYSWATSIGNHPFIEFTGLLNEYIKICRTAHEMGIDFTQCNTHTGMKLPVPPYSVDYINEKLECIFQGLSFSQQTEIKPIKRKTHGISGRRGQKEKRTRTKTK
jgi:hypothetical protein